MLVDKAAVHAVQAKRQLPSQTWQTHLGLPLRFEQKRGFSNSQVVHAECPLQPEV